MKANIQFDFPSPDAALVQALKSQIADASIGTRWKRDTTTPQIIVSLAAGKTIGNGTALTAAYNIRISSAKYADVEELSARVVKILRSYRKAPFHWIEVESWPISFTEDGFLGEQRMITVSALIAGK